MIPATPSDECRFPTPDGGSYHHGCQDCEARGHRHPSGVGGREPSIRRSDPRPRPGLPAPGRRDAPADPLLPRPDLPGTLTPATFTVTVPSSIDHLGQVLACRPMS